MKFRVSCYNCCVESIIEADYSKMAIDIKNKIKDVLKKEMSSFGAVLNYYLPPTYRERWVCEKCLWVPGQIVFIAVFVDGDINNKKKVSIQLR